MFIDPTNEHRWLQRFIGDWTFSNSSEGGPNGERMTWTGTERVVAYGDTWIVGDGEGEVPGGGHMRMRITLGYNPTKQKYIGSWIGTGMGMMFAYEGTREGDVLTMDTQGPSMADAAKTVNYQDIVELKSDDLRFLRSRVQGDDGKWTEFMRGEYRRKSMEA